MVFLMLVSTSLDLYLLGGLAPGMSLTPADFKAFIDLSHACPALGGGRGPDIRSIRAWRMGLGSLASLMASLA